MFFLIAQFLIVAAVIWWCYSGYMYYLLLYNLFRRHRINTLCVTNYPALSFIIPIYNERSFIEAKLKNIVDLRYPRNRIEVLVVDARSPDGSAALAEQFAQAYPDLALRVLQSPQQGRPFQINHALERASAPDLLVFTDADTLLHEEALLWIVSEFEKDSRAGVVGAWVAPVKTIPLEIKYWSYQNLLRWLESNIFSASIVIGPCYVARPGIMQRVPEDCSADDVFACFQANARGFTAKYVFEAKAYEQRNPATVLDYLNHKFRKANSYLVELVRFLYRFPTFHVRWKIVYLTKILQIIVMPFALVFFALLSLQLAFESPRGLIGVVATYLFFLINVAVTSGLLRAYFERLEHETLPGSAIQSFIHNNFVLFFAVASYLFHFQDSRPMKVNDAPPDAPAEPKPEAEMKRVD